MKVRHSSSLPVWPEMASSTLHPHDMPAPARVRSSEFLDAASEIAAQLAAAAVWDTGMCTWVAPGAGGATTLLEGDLYRGTAGIALFLAEVQVRTGAPEVARAARGAALHALAWANAQPQTRMGFLSGALGAHWALARVAALLPVPGAADGARATVRRLSGAPVAGYDVAAGAAGAVLALLALDGLAGEEALARATEMGSVLLRTGIPEPLGWSWSGDPRFARNLLGFVHGAAGIGHALLELAAATGESAFRFAAEQAWAYEGRFHDPTRGWPDFRSPPEAVSGRGLPYAPCVSASWCNGAAGIGLARARAWRLTGDAVHASDLRTAATLAAARLEEPEGSFSLCHGHAGTLDLLVTAADTLGEESFRVRAEGAAREAMARHRVTRVWPSGAGGGGARPGLFLGDAGVGLALLRLDDAATASPLLPCGTGTAAPPLRDTPALRDAAGRGAAVHFGRTLAAFRRLGAGGLPAGPPLSVYRALRMRVDAEANGRRAALLTDAFALDRARWECAVGAIDAIEDAPSRSDTAGAPEGDGRHTRYTLAPGIRLVVSRHDWDGWLSEPPAAEPRPAQVFHLLVRQTPSVRVVRLSPLAAAVVDALGTPATAGEVARQLRVGAPARFVDAVADQLASLVQGGMVLRLMNGWEDEWVTRLAKGGEDPAPPAARARRALVLRVATAREFTEGTDPLMALATATAVTAELRGMLHRIGAEPLFLHALRRCEIAASPAERLAAFARLLDEVERAYRDVDPPAALRAL